MTAKPPAELENSDFETIEAAVLETARGRWFLREFARRARGGDTLRLIEAVARIERMVSGEAAPPVLSADVEEPARELEARQDRLAEIAWMLRERGYDGDICALIEREARAVGRVAAQLRSGGRPPSEPDAQTEPAAEIAQAALPAPVRDIEPVIEAPDAADIAPPPLPTAPEPLPASPASATMTFPEEWRERARRALAPIERMGARERLAFFA